VSCCQSRNNQPEWTRSLVVTKRDTQKDVLGHAIPEGTRGIRASPAPRSAFVWESAVGVRETPPRDKAIDHDGSASAGSRAITQALETGERCILCGALPQLQQHRNVCGPPATVPSQSCVVCGSAVGILPSSSPPSRIENVAEPAADRFDLTRSPTVQGTQDLGAWRSSRSSRLLALQAGPKAPSWSGSWRESENRDCVGRVARGSSGDMSTTRMEGSWRIHGSAGTTTQQAERAKLEEMLVNCVGNEVVDERLLQLWLRGYLYASTQERETFVRTLSDGDRERFFRALSERTSGKSPGAVSTNGSFTASTTTRSARTPSSSSLSDKSSLPSPAPPMRTTITNLRRRAAEEAVRKSLVEEAEDFLGHKGRDFPRMEGAAVNRTHAETESLERRAGELAARRRQMEAANSFLLR
jgi:hypothetical protein